MLPGLVDVLHPARVIGRTPAGLVDAQPERIQVLGSLPASLLLHRYDTIMVWL